MHPRLPAFLFSAAILSPGLASADLFDIVVTVDGGGSSQLSFSSATDLVDILEDNTLETVNVNYTDTSVGNAVLNFRGIDIVAAYPTSGAEVVFSVPAIGFSQRFDEGATREANQNLFIDFLEDNGEGLLQDILRYLAAETPTDPVAGNPASLQSQMVAADFAIGSPIGAGSDAFVRTEGSGESGNNLLGFAARFSRFSAEDAEIDVLSLPLSYVVNFQNSDYALIFDLPLTYVEAEGSEAYAASLGVGLRVPITERWTITPSVRAGVTGSIDLGSIGAIASASVTSNFSWTFGGWNFDLGNGISYLETLPIDAGDTDISYDLSNTVLRNGIGARRASGIEILNTQTEWSAGIINTQFFGDDLFVENSTEISLALGTVKRTGRILFNQLSIGASYVFTNEDFDGFSLSAGYRF